jgi:hypothetical protein
LVAFNLTKDLAGEIVKENCYPRSNTACHMCYKNAETYR